MRKVKQNAEVVLGALLIVAGILALVSLAFPNTFIELTMAVSQ